MSDVEPVVKSDETIIEEKLDESIVQEVKDGVDSGLEKQSDGLEENDVSVGQSTLIGEQDQQAIDQDEKNVEKGDVSAKNLEETTDLMEEKILQNFDDTSKSTVETEKSIQLEIPPTVAEVQKKKDKSDKGDAKKLKILQTKLEVVEQKYIQTFKQNKELKKALQNTEQLCLNFFKGLGEECNIDELKNLEQQQVDQITERLFVQLENNIQKNLQLQLQEFDQKFEKQQVEHQEKVQNLEQKIAEILSKNNDQITQASLTLESSFGQQIEQAKIEYEEKISSLTKRHEESLEDITADHERYVKNLENEMEDQITSMKAKFELAIASKSDLAVKLQAECSSLLKALQEKEEKLIELQSIQRELNNNETDDLLSKFDEINSMSVTSQISDSEKTDQILKLKNDLEAAYELIEYLKLQAESVSDSQQNRMTEGDSQPYQGSIKPKCFEKHTQTAGQSHDLQGLQQDTSIADSNQQRDSESQNYLKNLIVKYFIYNARDNLKESKVIRGAILDFLKVNSEERAGIDEAMKGSGKGIMDAVYFFNIFGEK